MSSERLPILDRYLAAYSEYSSESFLDFACECMISSYILKTMYETRKSYCIESSFQRDHFTPTEDMLLDLTPINDTYDCFFYEIIKPLNFKQRQLLIFCYKLGYNDAFAAKKLGVTKQAVGAMKKRALKLLKTELRKDN